MTEEIKIHGLDELDKKFKELDVMTSRKILRASLMWASKPMWEEMKNTPFDPKGFDFFRLKDRRFSFKTFTRRWHSRDGKTDGYSAQVNIGYRMRGIWYIPAKGIRYLTELEFGTEDKAPLAWMRRAASSQWQAVVDRFAQRLSYRFKKLEK